MRPSIFLLSACLVVIAACVPSRTVEPPPSRGTAPPAASAEEGDEEPDREDEETPPPASTAKGHSRSHGHAPSAGGLACKPDLAHCTPIGCAKPKSPHALFNELKRRTKDASGNEITRESARTITFDQLRHLQTAADAALPDPKELTKAQREQIVSLHVPGGTFGEGTGVRLVGFVVPDNGSQSSGAHPGGIESVNCRLSRPEERDVHIPFVARPDQPECEGVVVEPIPQTRTEHPGWAQEPMRKLAKQKKLMMFVGPLFWDNEHKVNADCSHLVSGQPKRMSLWEIHPVTEVYVCESGTCTAEDKVGWQKVD